MADQRSKTTIQAHALRTAASLSALLHGTSRRTTELRSPMSAVIGGVAVTVALLVAVFVATKIGTLIAARDAG
jgi:hypothetical protein